MLDAVLANSALVGAADDEVDFADGPRGQCLAFVASAPLVAVVLAVGVVVDPAVACSAATKLGVERAREPGARLRKRDEAAFALLVGAWSPGMLRLARDFVSANDSASEVAQDTWMAVIEGIGRFEARSSLKTAGGEGVVSAERFLAGGFPITHRSPRSRNPR